MPVEVIADRRSLSGKCDGQKRVSSTVLARGTLGHMGGDDDAHWAYMRWQSETSDYRDRLLALARDSSHYSGSESRPEVQELVVFGVGRPSEAMVAMIREAPSNICVVWHEAPFSLEELGPEARRLMTEHPARLNSGGARYDGTCIEFTTTDAELLGADDPGRILGARYPVRVEFGTRAIAL
jgi:hypothetical protein